MGRRMAPGMSQEDEASLPISFAETIWTTPKAVLIRFHSGSQCWLPKSVTLEMDGRSAVVKAWWVRKHLKPEDY